MHPLKTYDYLTQARERIFDAVRGLAPQDYSREFTIGLKTLGSTLTHIMITEWMYTQRIQKLTPPPYDQWPIQDENPPALEVIERTWREQAAQTRRIVEAAAHDAAGWDRDFDYTSQARDGRKFIITVSCADIFTQMAFHEIHHRAQIMAMLRELGKPLQDIDYAYFMYKRRETS